MPCYHPLKAYNIGVKKDGKKTIVFKACNGAEEIKLPCGKCIGCRLEHARQWAMRCYHESALHEENSFITLTYDNEHLPEGETLVKKDLQDFMKRLRARIDEQYGKKVRFFACGEYGDEGKRPHYHILLFGYNFPDRQAWKTTKDGEIRYFISEELNKIWGKGFTLIAPVTYETSQYVAQYVTKKMTGVLTEMAYSIREYVDYSTGELKKIYLKYYDRLNPLTGEVKSVIPEFTQMSRRPGIGSDWYDKYKHDLYPKDFVTINGKEQRPAIYYDRKYEKEKPDIFRAVKEKREKFAMENQAEFTRSRLDQKEKVKKARLKKYYDRNLKEETEI